MPMTHVDLTLWDVGGGHLAAFQPDIIFTLNQAGAKDEGLFTTRPLIFTPKEDGSLSAWLTTTTDFPHDAWYTIAVRWLDPAGNYVQMDFPEWKVRVPVGGGALKNLIGLPTNARVIYVSLTRPTVLVPNMLWLEQDPNDPENPRNTGKLYEVRNGPMDLELVYIANLRGPEGRQGQPLVPKSAAVQLTTGVVGYMESGGAQNVRYPFKLSAGTKRVRLHIANYNDASDTPYVVPDLVLNKQVFVGRHRVAGDGSLTGEFAAAPHPITNFAAGNLPLPNSTEVVTEWMDVDIQSGIEYLLSLSYYNPGGAQIASGMGFTWRASATGDVDKVGPISGQVTSIKCPFSVWLEIEVPNIVPVVGHLGDSLLVGRESTYALHDSYANKHASTQGAMPRIHGIAGSRMTDWIGAPDSPRWKRFANLPTADACVIEIGSNDLFDFTANPGEAVAAMKSRLAQLVPLVRANISQNVYFATIMPRNVGSSSAAINSARREYNDFLMTLPHGALGCFDFSEAVEDRANPDRIASYLVSGDGVHLATGGYARMAAAIPGPLAGPRIS